jgi:hypothetical protein
MRLFMSNETIIPLADGKRLCCPAHPTPCEYVRVTNSAGQELACWNQAEWHEAPMEVMGALCGALAAPAETLEKPTPKPASRNALSAAQAYEAIAKLASAHGLILQGAGGALRIGHPATLKEHGLYCHTRWMAGLGPHAGSDNDPKAFCACKRTGKPGSCPAELQ